MYTYISIANTLKRHDTATLSETPEHPPSDVDGKLPSYVDVEYQVPRPHESRRDAYWLLQLGPTSAAQQ